MNNEIHQFQCEIIDLPSGNKKWNKGIARIQQVFSDNEKIYTHEEKLLFYTDVETSLQLGQGDVIFVKSQVQKIDNKGNPGEFNAEFYWGSKETYYLTFFTHSDFSMVEDSKIIMKEAIKAKIVKTIKRNVSEKNIGIVKALFLGDKSSLEQATRYSFSAAGAMHLLAISGLHIGLFIWIIFGFFRLFSVFIQRNTALLVALIFIWIYAYLIDFPPSVLRSVIMFSILSLGYFSRGIKNQLNILLFSASILLLINPMYLLDIGYQLSYLAMLGITLCYTSISQSFRFANKILNFFWSASALCLSAQLFTFPVCIYYFHQFPNYFLLSNFGIVILGGIIVGVGAALIILSRLTFLADKIACLLSLLLALLLGFIEYIENLPGSIAKGFNLEKIELTLLFFCCFGIYWNLIRKRRLLLGSAIGLILCSIIALNHNHQLSNKHLVLFNSSKFSCALHITNTTYFFHDDLSPNKYLLLLSDYDKCYPGKFKIINLKKQNLTVCTHGNTIKFTWTENGLLLNVNNENYNICYSQKEVLNNHQKTIGLAWIEGANIRLNKAYFFNF